MTIVHRYMFVSCCYPIHLTTELVYQNEGMPPFPKNIYNMVNLDVAASFFFRIRTKYWRRVPPLCNGKGSNADKVQDSETSLLVSKKADKNYIEDTETTQSPDLM